MRFIFLLLICIATYGQDSTKIKYGFEKSSTILIDKNDTDFNQHSLITLKPLRLWDLNSNKNLLNGTASIVPFVIKKKKESFVDSELFYVVVGSAIAFGAAAAFMKNESDKSYEKYKLTNDPKYLKKANNLDLYSGVSLGALQINFGYLIYKFLSD